MRKKFSLSIIINLFSLIIASVSSDEKLGKLISDYKTSPIKVLNLFLQDNDQIGLYLQSQFWSNIFTFNRGYYLASCRKKYKFDLPPERALDHNLLDLIRYNEREIKRVVSNITCDPNKNEENKLIFVHLDLLLDLAEKYFRKLKWLKYREIANDKIKKLVFVIDSIKSNLHYVEREENYKFLISVYDEMKLNYSGETILLKQRVKCLRCLFKCLAKILEGSYPTFREYDFPLDVAILRRNEDFKSLYSEKKQRQKVLLLLYNVIVRAFRNFIEENFMFLLGKEKKAPIEAVNYLIKISFFGQLGQYLEEQVKKPEFNSNFNQTYRRFIRPDFISWYKTIGKLELYLRRFIGKEDWAQK
jgi:hypothetical protein